MTALSDLLELDRRSLAALLRAGHPVSLEALADREWNGVSLGLPRLVEKLTWKKFKKVFVSGPAGLTGYNEAVAQNPLSEPWITKTRRGSPVRYGYFEVGTCEGHRVPGQWDRGLLIDYGPPAPIYDPMRFVKDPLVAVDRGSTDLLLGVSYVDLGPFQIPTPTYFALLPGEPLA